MSASLRRNRGHAYVERVGPEEAGRSLLEHHVRRHAHSSEEEWRARIEAGRVTINAAIASCDATLRAGDVIEYRRAPWDEAIVDPASIGVAWEDEHVLVVIKPAGLQVLPAGSRLEETLLHVLRGDDPARREWAPAHRLGRGTSGLQAIGKTPLARASLSRQFRERQVRKLYLAWVVGLGMPDSWIAEQPIGRVAHPRGPVHAATPDGKPSRTLVRTLRRDVANDRALVAASPITGRPDQIRIHLAASGWPIVGDPLFGRGGVLLDARPGDPGYLLHACSLRFTHPATGAAVRVRSLPAWVG